MFRGPFIGAFFCLNLFHKINIVHIRNLSYIDNYRLSYILKFETICVSKQHTEIYICRI